MFFLDIGSLTYRTRVAELPHMIREHWKSSVPADLNDESLQLRFVSKCVFYVMFGIWLDDTDADVLGAWKHVAPVFSFPRLVHRFFFNAGIRRVQTLRENTVRLIQKHNLEGTFAKMNAALPEQYRRFPVVKLCDEIMYVVCFAGVVGTATCVEHVTQFLQVVKPKGSHDIDFGEFQSSELMIKAYKEQPELYIREVCRLDPPVTSATHVIQEPAAIDMAGRFFTFPAGSLEQYVMAMANRDPAVFTRPATFEPDRTNITDSFSWHGKWSLDPMERTHDEQLYPRICPGRFLSLEISQAIINHMIA